VQPGCPHCHRREIVWPSQCGGGVWPTTAIHLRRDFFGLHFARKHRMDAGWWRTWPRLGLLWSGPSPGWAASSMAAVTASCRICPGGCGFPWAAARGSPARAGIDSRGQPCPARAPTEIYLALPQLRHVSPAVFCRAASKRLDGQVFALAAHLQGRAAILRLNLSATTMRRVLRLAVHSQICQCLSSRLAFYLLLGRSAFRVGWLTRRRRGRRRETESLHAAPRCPRPRRPTPGLWSRWRRSWACCGAFSRDGGWVSDAAAVLDLTFWALLAGIAGSRIPLCDRHMGDYARLCAGPAGLALPCARSRLRGAVPIVWQGGSGLLRRLSRRRRRGPVLTRAGGPGPWATWLICCSLARLGSRLGRVGCFLAGC